MSAKSILAASALTLSLPTTAARIDVHPQTFDCGGWSLDVQFMDVMGSPYLLAHGCGTRRTDAKAVVDIPEAGAWRVWARARKWTDGAGAFLVKVNGAELPRRFGTSQTEWAWEDGGEVELAKGRAEIALVDLDGFDGRCAGVVLARGEPAPTGPLSLDSREPDEDVEVDFAVVGGGMPGTCAAVAAARRGVKTAIVQDRPMLGGNASSEVRVWCAGEMRYPLVRELRGWFMNRSADMALSDANRMRLVQDEKNLSTLLCTRAFAVEKAQDGSIAAVKALDWKRNKVVRIKARLFCDATGDGWVGYWAGADWRMGREAKDEHGESFAPEKADDHTLGASLMWTSNTANTDIPFSAPWAEPHACGESAVNGEWNWEYGIRQDMIADGERIRDRLLLAIYGAFSLAKKAKENSRRVLNFVPFVLGKRESRRLMGDWVFSETDVSGKRQFEDAVATGSWSVDLHYDDAKEGVDFLTTCRQPHYGRYFIPYRSIYSRNVPNLFMVGRCFSCTHVGLGSPRVMNTLSQLGVAAGEAAALCMKYGCTPRAIYADGRCRELQRILGGDFPGNPDPALSGWKIVDDETPGVTFTGKWQHTFFCCGEQVGDKASTPVAGAGPATYPLQIEKAGRYSLMMRIPYFWSWDGKSDVRIVVKSGGSESELHVNQGIETGTWRKLGEFDLIPGATLTIDPTRSSGLVVADGFATVPADLH